MKKHFTLIIGISLPIIMILLVAGAIYLPQILVKPHYNFLYSDQFLNNVNNGRHYQQSSYYDVENGVLVKKEIPKEENENGNIEYIDPKLHFYDVVNNTTREISFADASQLSLLPGPTSPDGFIVQYSHHNDGIFELFGGSYDNNRGMYIKKGVSQHLLAIPNDQNYYYNGSFRVLGWIK